MTKQPFQGKSGGYKRIQYKSFDKSQKEYGGVPRKRKGWEIISPKPKLKFKDNAMLVIKTMLGRGY